MNAPVILAGGETAMSEKNESINKKASDTHESKEGKYYRMRYLAGKRPDERVVMAIPATKPSASPEVTNWIRKNKGIGRRRDPERFVSETHVTTSYLGVKVSRDDVLGRKKVKQMNFKESPQKPMTKTCGSEQYQCPVFLIEGDRDTRCEKSFRYKSALNDHIRDKHKTTPMDAWKTLITTPQKKREPVRQSTSDEEYADALHELMEAIDEQRSS